MRLEVGEIYEGKVTGITKFEGQTGMVHISEIAPTFVNEIRDFVSEGQTVKVKVLNISEEGKISLSMKKALPPEEQQHKPRRPGPGGRKPGPRPPRAPRPEPQPGPGRPGDFEWQGRRNDSGSLEDMISDLKRGNESRRGYSRRGQKQ